MSRPVSTSIWADAWRAVDRLLREQNWPAPPSNSKGVKVFTSAFGKEGPPDESVLLITETIEDEQSYAMLGEQRKDETFLLQIDVATMLPHKTWEEATARTEALVAVIERMFHRTTRVGAHPPELAGRLVKWEVTRVAPLVGVMTNGAFFGSAVLLVKVSARIKPTNPT